MHHTNASVAAHYDASAEQYHLQYDAALLNDLSQPYPANYFRLQMLLDAFKREGVRRVIEVGVGEGTPIASLAKTGVEVSGFDISENMVARCRSHVASLGIPPERIIWGDVRLPESYAPLMQQGAYDGLMAMGVMPHVEDDAAVLRNMQQMVKPGGSVFIEFRNQLFSLFTFNRYTYAFIMDDLLAGVSPVLKDAVSAQLKSRLEMDKPAPEMVHQSNESAPGYDAILSKFHNPFEVLPLFASLGFKDASLLWYHYHPAMPFLEGVNPALFREEAMKLEFEPSGWRGMFLCSAFVVQAKTHVG